MYINQRLAISVNTQNVPYPQKEFCSICAYFLKVCRRLCSRPCWMEWRSEERCHWHPQNWLQSSTVYRAPGHLSSSSRMRPTLVVYNNVSVLVQLASSCCAEERTQVFTVHDRSGNHESESRINFRQKNSAGNLKKILLSRVTICSLFHTSLHSFCAKFG